MNHKKDLLDKAEDLVNGPRSKSYGDTLVNHLRIADFWNDWLRNRSWGADGVITPYDVSIMMILVKLARSQQKPSEDNHVDIAGYAAVSHDIWERMIGVEDGREIQQTTKDGEASEDMEHSVPTGDH